MLRRIRQLIRLYKLLGMDDRLTELDGRATASAAWMAALDKSVRAQMETSQNIREQLDLLKSSLEVREDLINDFAEWKVRTRVPAQPLVSVCVPTYNRATLLAERCIPSVLKQTYRNFEIIVVGDNCTDETENVIAGINDARLTFVNLPNRSSLPSDSVFRWMVAGTAAANKLLSMAHGDFITHLDDDDEYLPERLEKLVLFATENKSDFVWHPFWFQSENGEWILNEAFTFARGQLTHSSVFYRSWFTKIEADPNAYRFMEPGDWSRFRRIKYVGPVSHRYPEPLVRHYRERNRNG